MASIKNVAHSAGQISRRSRQLVVYALFTAIASGMAGSAKAQTFAEWFEQKKTQKKYLLQQIAALQVFSGYLKQGYQIAGHGLGSISGSLKNENGLHAAYYNKLKSVNPVVRNNPQVGEIIRRQNDILASMKNLEQIRGLTPEEMNYLGQVKTALLKDCDQQMTDLQSVLTDNKAEMSDQERISLLNKIDKAMQENYRFASGFTAQARLYTLQKTKEAADAGTGKRIYGIP